MMNRAVVVVCLGGLVGLGHAGATLYGVASFTPTGFQSLYAIDASTGAATLIGNTGLRQIAGLDWDSTTRTVVALTVAGDQFDLDLSSGAASLREDAFFGVPEGSIALRGGRAFTTIFDNLNVWSGSEWTEVGTSGLVAGADVSGLDFGGGKLLGIASNGSGNDELVSYNAATGSASVIGLTGTNASSVAGLAYGLGSSVWYMTDGSSLYTLNVATGAASEIGLHGITGFSGLAFVPSPGGAVLVAAGLLLGTRRRR